MIDHNQPFFSNLDFCIYFDYQPDCDVIASILLKGKSVDTLLGFLPHIQRFMIKRSLPAELIGYEVVRPEVVRLSRNEAEYKKWATRAKIAHFYPEEKC